MYNSDQNIRKSNGKIYEIGVGPGDPEDMTIKAVNKIKESDILVFPKKDLEKCRAYKIVEQVIPEVKNKDIISFEFEMTKDQLKKENNHRQIYDLVKNFAFQGKTVALLTIGDPSIYSTCSYIFELAKKDGIEVDSINGISSITACANRLGITLADEDEQLHIITTVDDIEKALNLSGTKVIMKCGKHIHDIKEILKKKKNISVSAISDCGTPDEKCYRTLDEFPAEGNYFLTVIVKEEK